jgi:hypothetical protein
MQLVHNELNKRGELFEMIFISSDQNQEAFEDYCDKSIEKEKIKVERISGYVN